MISKYIVGLGNPGTQYSKQYHNLGLIFANWLCEIYPNELIAKKPDYELFKFEKFHLIKPNTFMNSSFKAIGSIYNMCKLKATNFLVMHDDLMLPKHELKLKIPDGTTPPGNAGHNGLRDISQGMSANFARLRIGIDHPKNFDPRISVTNYVLSNIDNIPAFKKAFDEVGIDLINQWVDE